jgi:predicted enzyme related to lactoylglutathione lyase
MPAVICWTDIPVVDLDRAIAFYSAVLGEEVVKQSFEGYSFGLLPHANDNVSGCLYISEENKPSQQGPLVYLNVTGRLDQAIGAVAANGGEVVKGKHPIGPHGFRAIFVDSEGNKLALHSTTE